MYISQRKSASLFLAARIRFASLWHVEYTPSMLAMAFANSWFDHNLPITACAFSRLCSDCTDANSIRPAETEEKEIVLGCRCVGSTTVFFKGAFQMWKVRRRRSVCQQLVGSRVPCKSATQIQWSQIRDPYWDVFMHWEIGLKFRDFEVGIPDWDCETNIYNSKFIESLLLLGEKTQEWKFRICIPPTILCISWYGYADCYRFSTVFSEKDAFLWEPRCPISFLAFPSDQRRTSWIAHWNWELRGPKVRERTGQLENCGSPIQQEVMIWNVLVNLESGQP